MVNLTSLLDLRFQPVSSKPTAGAGYDTSTQGPAFSADGRLKRHRAPLRDIRLGVRIALLHFSFKKG